MTHNQNQDQNQDQNQEDSTLDPITSINIIDKFLHIYNAKNGTIGPIFAGIDIKDPVATNNKMETFYGYMQQHKLLHDENPVLIDVYDSDVDVKTIVGRDDHEMYALIKDTTVKFLSLSFISLLTVGVKIENNLDSDHGKLGSDWSIVEIG
jgi:hypothetical protein